MVIDWYQITSQAMENFWTSFLLFLPNLLLAILILIFGWFIAVGLGKLSEEVLKKLKFDKVFNKEGWKDALEKAKIKISISSFIGSAVKWILFLVFLWASVGVLGLIYFAEFMGDIIRYIPNVLVAALIFVVAVIMADFLSKIVIVATERAHFKFTHLAGEIVRWSIWIFAIFAILIELGIAREMLSTLFTGIVALFALAGGLAFGLGGKEAVADTIEKLRGKMKE